MKRLIFIFLLLFVSVGLGVQLNKDPGYVLIAMNHWTVETPLWFALLAVLICFLVLHFLLQIIHGIGQTKSVLSRWRSKRRYRTSKRKTRRGLIEFSEGYWQEAETHLVKGMGNSDVPLINYLAAAKAAQEQGNNKQRDNYLREAQQSMPEAKIAIELTQAQLQLANNQWEQALATLKHLQSLAPRHPYVLKLLMKLYTAVKDWDNLLELLPDLKRLKVIDNQAYHKLELQIHQNLLLNKAEKLTAEELVVAFQRLPKSVQNDETMLIEVCHMLLNKKAFDSCELLIRNSLKKSWNEELVALYGYAPIENSKKQLNFVESLLKQHPHSANLYLSLGKLSSHNQLWGKARSYLEQSLAICPSSEAHYELAKLLEQLHEDELAKQNYRLGLAMSLNQA